MLCAASGDLHFLTFSGIQVPEIQVTLFVSSCLKHNPCFLVCWQHQGLGSGEFMMASTLNGAFSVHICQQSHHGQGMRPIILTTAVSINSPYGRFSLSAAGELWFNGERQLASEHAEVSFGAVRVTTTTSKADKQGHDLGQPSQDETVSAI
jgi:hypothetical protein